MMTMFSWVCLEISSVSTLLIACSIADLCFLLPYCSSGIMLAASPFSLAIFPTYLLLWLNIASISVTSLNFAGRRSFVFFFNITFVHSFHAVGAYPVSSGTFARVVCTLLAIGAPVLSDFKCPKCSPGCEDVFSFILFQLTLYCSSLNFNGFGPIVVVVSRISSNHSLVPLSNPGGSGKFGSIAFSHCWKLSSSSLKILLSGSSRSGVLSACVSFSTLAILMAISIASLSVIIFLVPFMLSSSTYSRPLRVSFLWDALILR